MLKQRILTALVLLPLVIGAILLLPPMGFSLLLAVIVGIAVFEWAKLVGLVSLYSQLSYVFSMLVLAGLIQAYVPIIFMLCVSVAVWILMSFWVLRYPQGSLMWNKTVLARMIVGFFIFVPCWLALTWVRTVGASSAWVFFLLILIWSVDTGAYFVGVRWGKHRLAPAVSPAKSWEGIAGALCTSVLVGLVMGTCLHLTVVKTLVLVAIVLISSVLGDLMESMVKRERGVKDTGAWLPGHGGFFDRIDSMTAAAPVFALSLILLGIP